MSWHNKAGHASHDYGSVPQRCPVRTAAPRDPFDKWSDPGHFSLSLSFWQHRADLILYPRLNLRVVSKYAPNLDVPAYADFRNCVYVSVFNSKRLNALGSRRKFLSATAGCSRLAQRWVGQYVFFRCEWQITSGKLKAGFKISIRLLRVTFEGHALTAPTLSAPEGQKLPRTGIILSTICMRCARKHGTAASAYRIE